MQSLPDMNAWYSEARTGAPGDQRHPITNSTPHVVGHGYAELVPMQQQYTKSYCAARTEGGIHHTAFTRSQRDGRMNTNERVEHTPPQSEVKAHKWVSQKGTFKCTKGPTKGNLQVNA
eukprot:1592094-Amphidinium_carterae.1